MARDFVIQGESLVLVKGNTSSAIASLSQLGLPATPIRVTPEFRHRDIKVDAWGEAPPEIQFMLASVTIKMDLVHVDMGILQTCVQESMAGATTFGTLTRAGSRMGNNLPRFGSTGPASNQSNHFIGLNIAAPVDNLPWRFLFAYLTGPPIEQPLGTEASVITLNWRAIPYTQDPANIIGGVITGAQGALLWDRTLDS